MSRPLVEGSDAPVTVSPMTVLRFLSGNRPAILEIASSRNTVLLGGILVLSAGFAREYDGEDLLREPWHLLIPHAASFITAFVLYCMVRMVALRRKASLPGFMSGFGLFLGLYWMTAPLAWVYAIPFERWLGPGAATQLNLMLLGIVACWRVVLIIRVIQVVFGAKSTLNVVMTVLLFGDGVMLVAIDLMPVPILQMMGGVRLTETESVMQGAVLLLRLVGILGLPILVIGYAIAFRSTPLWGPPDIGPPRKISTSSWIAAAVTILVWGAVLPITQPEQQLRWQVEHDLKSGRVSEAVQFMSMHDRSDFPPHWDPPPHVALESHSPHIADVISVVISENPADWVQNLYLDKFQRKIADEFSLYSQATAQQRAPYLRNLSDLPVEFWYPDDEWAADQFRTVLKEMVSNDELDAGTEIRELASKALSMLPQQPFTSEETPTESEVIEIGEPASSLGQ